MKEKFLDGSIQLITRYQKVQEGDISKLRYGLEGLYLTFTKMVVIFILSAILGIFKEIIILLIFFNIIRFTGFGFHAKSSVECLLISILSFVLLPFLLLHITISKNVMLVVGILGTIYLFFYAPADTIKRPLPNKKKRTIRKIITVITATVFTILSFLISNNTISVLLVTSIILEDMMVSPITYKIFKQPYRNYLTYQKKMA